jgi:type II secretory pathway component PulJ
MKACVQRRGIGAGHEAGLGLVELMVGLAVGALVVSGALAATSQHLRVSHDANQRLRAQQDLRAVGAVVNRWLRQAVASEDGNVFTLSADASMLAFQVPADEGAAATPVEVTPVAVRLQGGVIEWRWGPPATGRWQALSDPAHWRVRRLRFEQVLTPEGSTCGRPALLRWTMEAVPAHAIRAGAAQGPEQNPERTTHQVLVRHPSAAIGCGS